ncbi:hypothetical protein LY76DRAFT_237527 [Colletotrichum caudatum]|nr:hypothetical protein LY76DRAFT_237527 [Colletotrichum caudatum]
MRNTKVGRRMVLLERSGNESMAAMGKGRAEDGKGEKREGRDGRYSIEPYRFELRSNGARRLSVVGSFPRLFGGSGRVCRKRRNGTVGFGRPGSRHTHTHTHSLSLSPQWIKCPRGSARLERAGCLKLVYPSRRRRASLGAPPRPGLMLASAGLAICAAELPRQKAIGGACCFPPLFCVLFWCGFLCVFFFKDFFSFFSLFFFPFLFS